MLPKYFVLESAVVVMAVASFEILTFVDTDAPFGARIETGAVKVFSGFDRDAVVRHRGIERYTGTLSVVVLNQTVLATLHIAHPRYTRSGIVHDAFVERLCMYTSVDEDTREINA